MLDRLERANRAAELDARFGVLHGVVQHALRSADLLRRQRRGSHLERALEAGTRTTRRANHRGGSTDKFETTLFARLVHGGQ